MRISDWSSDVCSSDLFPDAAGSRSSGAPVRPWPRTGRNSAAFRAEPALHRRLDRQRQFMPAFIRDESRPRAAGAGEIGFRLLELVARDHIVELAPADEDRLVEQAVVRQVAVLHREAAADPDEAAEGPRVAAQTTIGRAAGRARVWRYVSILGVVV